MTLDDKKVTCKRCLRAAVSLQEQFEKLRAKTHPDSSRRRHDDGNL